jgi:hypothetical protein
LEAFSALLETKSRIRSLSKVAARVQAPSWSLPVALAIVCFITFGLFIPSLGFYQDDWHHVYYAYARGLDSLKELFLFDNRPFAALFYIPAFKLLGFQALHWQLFSLAIRSLAVIAAWLCVGALWPGHTRAAAWTALVFAVYPLFNLQSLSVVYSMHWMGYLLFLISLWAMIQSIRQPRRYAVFTALSLVTAGLHLALLEYFAGVELARPLVLWFLQAGQPAKRRARGALRLWLPYLGLLAFYAVYRVFLLPTPASNPGQNPVPPLLAALVNAPLEGILRLVQKVLQDTTSILFTAWSSAISPQLFEISLSANVKALLVGLALGLALYLYFSTLHTGKNTVPPSGEAWQRQALALGLALTVLGPLPAWLIDRDITNANPLWSSRFGLPAMLGASLVIVALVYSLLLDRRYRTALLCALVGLAASWQVLNSNDFRWAWSKQSTFYQQLYWRAPYILPDTALLSDGEFLPYMGEYPTAFAVSTLYPKQDAASSSIDHWYFSLYKHFDAQRQDLVRGMTLEDSTYSSHFSADSRNSLVISFVPENGQCLWVLSAQDRDIPGLPDIIREVLDASNLSRIQADSPEKGPYPAQIFGDAHTDSWCYYFEKGDLARQSRDWSQVVDLWNQADKAGFHPSSGVEYVPFIQGFAYTEEWQSAEKMSLQANRISQGMRPLLCGVWQDILAGTTASAARQAAWENLQDRLDCSP